MGDYGVADIAFLVLGGIFGTGSFTMLGLVIYAIHSRHRAQQTYLPVDAVVVSQRLIEHSETYEPRVEYEFVLDGVTHKSSNVWAGPNDSSSLWLKDAQQILDQFPVGQQVQAFYDPDDPEQAFLLHTPPASGVFGGYFILFFCVVVIIILFSIAWHIDLLWELIAAHALAVVAAFGWFLCVARRDGA
jgi:hypothetical protein